MPMLAEMRTSCSPSGNGSVVAAITLHTTTSRAAISVKSSISTTNSSPPKRAGVPGVVSRALASDLRRVSRSRFANAPVRDRRRRDRAVVDPLEAVEINQQQRQMAFLSCRLGERIVEELGEHVAIG